MKKKTLMATMALFSAMAWADGLPEGYTQLPFLKATGNCQVKTGLTPASTDTAELTFELSTVSGNQNLWCSRNDSTASFTAFMIADKVRLDRNTTQVTSTAGLAVGTKYTLTANYATGFGDVIYADSGSPVTDITGLGTDEYTPATELCLFASHTTSVDTGLNNYGSWTFYSFSLADADNEFRSKLVPARRASDGVLGLYDTVRDVFLTNGLAGTLTLGDGYTIDENGNVFLTITANAQGTGTVQAGDGEAGSTATASIAYDAAQAGTQSATFTATPGEGVNFYWALGEGVTLTSGTIYDTTISVTATKPGSVTARFFSASSLFAKLVDGTFHYYEDKSCTSELPPQLAPQSIAGCVVLFGSDAEYQALVPYTNELATAFVVLQNDVTLTADADWSAFDFNMDGKAVTLRGYDLKVHKPVNGRFSAGNLIDPLSRTGNGSDTWSAGGGWWNVGTKSKNNALWWDFTPPKSRNIYIACKTKKYGTSTYSQYIYFDVGGSVYMNYTYTGPNASEVWRGPWTKAVTGGNQIRAMVRRSNGYSMIGFVTISPESHLTFDVPEGEEVDTSSLSFGGASVSTYEGDYGLGIEIHKTGKGTLLLNKAWTLATGTSGGTSVVVEEGLVKKTPGLTAGGQNARIRVEDGAQFEVVGADSSANYDFTLAGSGPDGLGALVNNTELTGTDVPSFPVRNVTLSTNAVIGGSQPFSLKNGNWAATTTTLNGYTLTYTNATVYAGNVTYNGGNVVVPSGTEFVFEGHNSTAPSADVTINGQLVMNNGGFSTIQSLIFAEGSQLVLSDTASSGSIPTTVVTGRYAPASSCVTNGTCTLTTQPVQLGDASHLGPEFDLSSVTGVFDGSNTTFYAGTTITVNLGSREFTGSELLVAWSEMSTATFVVDEVNYDRLGMWARPDGLYIFPGRVPSYVKYDVENDCWKFFDEDVNPYVGEWTLGMDYMKALFANDAEFQGLASHKADLEAAHAPVLMQSDITLTADADWSAIDFDMNGKTVTLRGWDLTVRKPQGLGRITSGNLINQTAFSLAHSAWHDGGGWYGFAGSQANSYGNKDVYQSFTVPKARDVYLQFRVHSWNNSGYAQYVCAGINSVNNLVNRFQSGTASSASSYYQTTSIYTKSGLNPGTSYELEFTNYGGYTYAGDIFLCPLSKLIFDIPENDEYVLTGITLGGTSDVDFSGIGLHVHKTGKGLLTMSKENLRFGGNGVISIVVEEGLVKKEAGATCGAPYSRIRVEDGGQFDMNGHRYHDYHYSLSGSGPDGVGALINTVSMSNPWTVDGSKYGMLYNVTLDDDATIGGTANFGMIFYDNGAHTMTMNNKTVTYAGTEIFAGQMNYSGDGKIVIATNGWLQSCTSSASAPGCVVEVYGILGQQDGKVLSPVKSLIFADGGKFYNYKGTPGTVTVYGTYAPNVEEAVVDGSTVLHPKVQLGDATHLNATLDLSQWTTTFDDREEGSLTFYAGTEEAPMTVALDIGERTAGLVRYGEVCPFREHGQARCEVHRARRWPPLRERIYHLLPVIDVAAGGSRLSRPCGADVRR